MMCADMVSDSFLLRSMGHQSCEDEMEAFASFLEKVFFGATGDEL